MKTNKTSAELATEVWNAMTRASKKLIIDSGTTKEQWIASKTQEYEDTRNAKAAQEVVESQIEVAPEVVSEATEQAQDTEREFLYNVSRLAKDIRTKLAANEKTWEQVAEVLTGQDEMVLGLARKNHLKLNGWSKENLVEELQARLLTMSVDGVAITEDILRKVAEMGISKRDRFQNEIDKFMGMNNLKLEEIQSLVCEFVNNARALYEASEATFGIRINPLDGNITLVNPFGQQLHKGGESNRVITNLPNTLPGYNKRKMVVMPNLNLSTKIGDVTYQLVSDNEMWTLIVSNGSNSQKATGKIGDFNNTPSQHLTLLKQKVGIRGNVSIYSVFPQPIYFGYAPHGSKAIAPEGKYLTMFQEASVA